ncbi:helix-turn-helix domain-containing protein [Loigolactobacillus iwatensis]|uniref:helix-turn-helix domain-containing protein n=1 Tax=Loigolactobacillus iwatensis TaxID=1267156 RepID=UPI000F7D5BB3|nr:helix-turn-helix domain-containing protein [Loigolactobacillus iwatensis]
MATVVFAQQLRKLRKERGLSQDNIAAKLYISRQAVSRWESKDATPDLTNLVLLADILEVGLDELILRQEQNQKNMNSEKVEANNNDYVVNPTTGIYKHRRPTNFWEFMASYWWVIFAIGGWLTWFLPIIVREIFKAIG